MTMVYVLGAFPKVSETFISGEIAELRRRGVDVTVFSLRHPLEPGPAQPEDAAILDCTTYLPVGRRGTLCMAAEVMRLFAEHPGRATGTAWWALRRAMTAMSRGDLLRFAQAAYISRRLPESAEHLHAHFAHGPATCAAMVSRLCGVPYSFTAHARDIFEYADKRSVRDKVATARVVIAISEHGGRRVVELAGDRHADRVQIVPNGIDLTRFARRATEPTGPPRVLCVGRLVEKKGQDTLLRAIGMLADEGRMVQCELIGAGPLRAELERTVHWLGIGAHVSFRGSLDAIGVRAAYDAATVFALPCQTDSHGDQDGLPVSLVEAMAVGVPVISTGIAGIPELITDGVSGLLVEPHDARGLADAIARVIDEPALRRSLTHAARQVAEAYDRTLTTQRLLQATGMEYARAQ
ncbi:MAG: glycosyltransferase [Actinomycetes bacterium]